MTSGAPVAPPRDGMGVGRILLIVFGSIIALIGLALAAAGGAILFANQTLRDDEGFFTTRTETYSTATRALRSEDLSIVGGAPVDIADGDFATIRLRVTPSGAAGAIFVGIGRASDVDAYLRGVVHETVVNVDFDPFEVESTRTAGVRAPAEPASQAFWSAQSSGTGTQTVRWAVRSGTWSVVVMNADGSPGVRFDGNVGARISHLAWIGGGLLAGGLLILAGGIVMIVFGARGRRGTPPPAAAGQVSEQGLVAPAIEGAAPGTFAGGPVRLEGHLDPDVSRWLWLVKWLLTIPHWIVLVFLWIAFWVLTVIAFFAILFTGRYPRGIFDFNVGVLRWTWRVAFYGYSALGTDRYPPFTLEDVADYPARLQVDHPERLSRGLVLVKWWLLAIPQYIIVAILGGWATGAPGVLGVWRAGDWWEGWPGLIGVLVFIGAIALLFAGRFPRGLFDFVVGLDRWVFRVIVYAGLMRDEYPPFRLDMGEAEPVSTVSTADRAGPPAAG